MNVVKCHTKFHIQFVPGMEFLAKNKTLSVRKLNGDMEGPWHHFCKHVFSCI